MNRFGNLASKVKNKTQLKNLTRIKKTKNH
jgi:hypothetical protein